MLTAPVLLLLKVSLLLAAALLVSQMLRVAPASRRHTLWSGAFAALLAFPVLALFLPTLRIPLPVPDTSPTLVTTAQVTRPLADHSQGDALSSVPNAFFERVDTQPAASAVSLPSARTAALGVWAIGALMVLVSLVVSIARVRLLKARATALDDPLWHASAARFARHFGMETDIRLVTSAGVTTPMAGGIFEPTVFLPTDALQWSREVRDIVLAHEIAHLANRDPLRHLVARAAFALYWMHPFTWLAARRAAVACEQACDETVLAAGIRPSTYANVLLSFASAPTPRLSVALPIVRRTLLETRLMAILNPSARPTGRRPSLLAGAVAGMLTLCLAAAQPTQSPVPPVPPATSAPLIQATHPATPAPVAPVNTPPVATPAVPVAAPAAATPPTAAAPVAGLAQETCWLDANDNRSFSGSISMSGRLGRIYEQIGRRGSDWIIQKSFDDLRVCALAEDLGNRDVNIVPSEWPTRAAVTVLETRVSNEVRRMTFEDGRVTFTVNGNARAIDATANAWRSALLAVLDDTWRLGNLRGRASSLRGEISSIHGQRSSLRGEISSLRGEISSMRGEISSLHGHESSMRGQISSIRGHESSLRGQISSERGAISSLSASRWESSDASRARIDERIRQHEQQIRLIEKEIQDYDADARVRDVERRITALNFPAQVAAVERQIRDFDLDGKVARVEARIKALEVEKQVGEIEREIDALKLDENTRELEARIEASLRRLRATL